MSAHYKTVWLSDIHLGCKDCKAELLLDFLNNHSMDTLYLVGDIVDFWALTRQFSWPESHNRVLHKLFMLSGEGTRVVYLPGNHDEALKPYVNMLFGEVEIKHRAIHETAQGKRLLILHGDDFDADVCYGRFHAWLGDKLYDLLLFLNRNVNSYRRRRGFHYWSLASYIKSKVKSANVAIGRYRQAALNEAKKHQLDGVVCGHIHHPEIVEHDGLVYCNDGDWVENCSALIEDKHGQIRLQYWTVMSAKHPQPVPLNQSEAA